MNLVWIDLETTGLNPINDSILEVGVIVTTPDLDELESMSWYVEPRSHSMVKMNDFVRNMHTVNGLLEAHANGVVQKAWDVATEIHEMIHPHVAEPSPLCGSSVHFDRRFCEASMPTLLADTSLFNHRNVDVSVLRTLQKMWMPEFAYEHSPNTDHRALPDLRDSISLLREMRERLLVEELRAG